MTRPSPIRVAFRHLLAAKPSPPIDLRKSRSIRGAVQEIGAKLGWGFNPVWVIDPNGLLDGVRDLPKQIQNNAIVFLMEELAYAAERDDLQSQNSIGHLHLKIERARIRVEKVLSPRSGLPGWKITY